MLSRRSLGVLFVGIGSLMGRSSPGAYAQTASASASADAGANSIQAYIDQNYYKMSDVDYSFHSQFGEDIDCIPFEAQASVKWRRAQGKSVITLSQVPTFPGRVPANLHSDADLFFDGQLDDEGRPRSCPPGDVAQLRRTVAQIQAIGGLDALRAINRKDSPSPQSDCSSGGANYAHVLANLTAPYGSPTMLGGGTITAVYNPPIGTDVVSHSLSQTWTFSAFPYLEVCDPSCTGPDCLQSVEIGWNVDSSANFLQDPYGTHLFIYSTKDDYTSTGCYNGFQATEGGECLQGNSLGTVVAGMALSYNYGLYPTEIQFDTYNYEGNWYLAVNGTTDFVYYGDQYNGSFGTSAGAFQVGGEVEAPPPTFDVPSESDSWYPGDGVGMGSGYCAEADQARLSPCLIFLLRRRRRSHRLVDRSAESSGLRSRSHFHVGVLLRTTIKATASRTGVHRMSALMATTIRSSILVVTERVTARETNFALS